MRVSNNSNNNLYKAGMCVLCNLCFQVTIFSEQRPEWYAHRIPTANAIPTHSGLKSGIQGVGIVYVVGIPCATRHTNTGASSLTAH